MKPVYVIDACRTPIGRFGGTLSLVRPDDLLALVLTAVMERSPSVPGSAIDEVIAGAANQAGEDNRNVARMAALIAGLPVTVPGVTVNRLCASGLEAIMQGSRTIACGDADLVIASGVESMTRAPFVTAKASRPFQRETETFDTTLGWRFVNPRLAALHPPYSMGETAEQVADQWKISREEQDAFAYRSQSNYARALEEGRWTDELVPVPVLDPRSGALLVERDEHPRLSTIQKLQALKPAFREGGSVTAANCAGINDGAAALLLAGEEAIVKYGLRPMARVVSMAVAGVDPSIMGIGPVPATRKALDRAGLRTDDLSLIELNEAFASQALACIGELGLQPDLINVNGGAIALGHPLGASGVRMSTTLLHQLRRQESSDAYGLATMCVGVGQGASIIFQSM